MREWLAEFFGRRVIALYHDIEWPPRSPDLTPCDFFLWGYIKSKVYVTPPQSIEDLIQRIRTAFENLKENEDLIRRAMRNMLIRTQTCIEKEGAHIERFLENK